MDTVKDDIICDTHKCNNYVELGIPSTETKCPVHRVIKEKEEELKNYPLQVELTQWYGWDKEKQEYCIHRRYTALNTSYRFNQGTYEDMKQIASKFNFNGITILYV
jgi:hypothetical protein